MVLVLLLQSATKPGRRPILMLRDQVRRFEPSSHTNAQERLAGMQRLQNWTEELDECVVKSASALSIKDWQNAVFLDSQLTRKFDAESEAIKAEEGQHTLQANYELFKARQQQWLNEYNDLVHKYNDLVRDYNGQRDLIIRLIATPPPLPPVRTFVHCSTFNLVGYFLDHGVAPLQKGQAYYLGIWRMSCEVSPFRADSLQLVAAAAPHFP